MSRPPLPDLVIGGAPRSGTTFLCEVLAKHPDVYVAQPFIPEPKVCMTPHPDGAEGLRGRYATYFEGAPEDSLRVEKSSHYLENAEARARIAPLLPNAKFLFILREPVARAFSNWLWSRRNGLETLDFADAIAREGQRADPFPPEKSYVRPFDYMTRGRYGSFARAWLDAVDPARVKFMIFEEAIKSPENMVAELQAFAGLRPLSWSRLATGQINQTEPLPEDFDPSLLARLRERIRPEVEDFTAQTGIDVSIWNVRAA